MDPILRTLLDRLRNETTRLPAVKAVAAAAASPLPLPALGGPVAEGFGAELTSFLRKSNRRARARVMDKRSPVVHSIHDCDDSVRCRMCGVPLLPFAPAACAPKSAPKRPLPPPAARPHHPARLPPRPQTTPEHRSLRAASLAALEALCARPNLQLDAASFSAVRRRGVRGA